MAESASGILRVDALRGIAAVAVAFYHVRVDLWVGWAAIQANPQAFSILDWTLSWLGVPMRFMGTGVLLFFVISGYCIHRPQAEAGRKTKKLRSKNPKSRDEPGGGRASGNPSFQLSESQISAFPKVCDPSWLRFYIRRFLRIYPPYLVVLLLSGLVLAITAGLTGATLSRLWASLAMMQNYCPPGGQIPTNPSLWSLPVEMELYLVYPLAWWLGRQVGWCWVVVLAVFVSLAGQWASLNGVRWLDASFPRFWALWCAGAWVAERRCRGTLPGWDGRWSLWLAGLLIAAVASERTPIFHGLSIWLWGSVGVLALIWASGPVRQSSESFFTRWFALAAWIGTFSYSLYLIHYPLFHLAGYVWQGQFGAKPTSMLVPLAAALLVIPLAWLFHRWIEAPSHRLARSLGRSSHGVVGRK